MTNSADPARWPLAERIPAEEVAKARNELLNLIQWPVRIANSYIEGDVRDRTALEFRPLEAVFSTKTFEGDFALRLQLPSLELQFLQDGKPVPHVFDPNERSPAEIEAWFLVELLHRGIDRERFSKKLPYAMSGLMTGDAEDHMPSLCRGGLEYLTSWLQRAGRVLTSLCNGKNVICSPQTLNLTCEGEPGFGFSLSEPGSGEPAFYAMQSSSNGSASPQKRVTLPVSTLREKPDPEAAVLEFLKA